MTNPNILAPGTIIDKYEILGPLGLGGMARIYLARLQGPGQFEKRCAIKVMQTESDDDAASEVLVHEASVAARLHHPNIVQVFDLGTYQGRYFMAMEWVDGISTARLLNAIARQRRLLPIAQVVHIAARTAEALEYLRDGVTLDGRKSSLVHRDVSPSNVLISNSGSVKLTDFGIVKVLEAPSSTRVGVVKGKYAYMAPEQLRGDAVDHRSDVFGLGVVLFEALTCRRLFHRKTLAATVAAVHAARVLPPSVINEDVPHELDRVVLKAVARRPEDRFQTAGEFLEALEPFRNAAASAALAQEVAAVMELDASADPDSPRSASFLVPLHTPPPPVPDETQAEELPDLRDEEFEALEREMGPLDEGTSEYGQDEDDLGSMSANRTPAFVDPKSSPNIEAELMMASNRSNPSIALPLVILIGTALGILAFWWMVLNPTS